MAVQPFKILLKAGLVQSKLPAVGTFVKSIGIFLFCERIIFDNHRRFEYGLLKSKIIKFFVFSPVPMCCFGPLSLGLGKKLQGRSWLFWADQPERVVRLNDADQ